jgi:hypothetical protein
MRRFERLEIQTNRAGVAMGEGQSAMGKGAES